MKHISLLLIILMVLILTFVSKIMLDVEAVAQYENLSQIGSDHIKAPPFTYIFTGDTGTGNSNQIAVANSIEKYCGDNCLNIFIAGDVIYRYGVTTPDDIQFETKFENIYKDIKSEFYISYGNHDYYGCKECYLLRESYSDKWNMPAEYYSIRVSDDIEVFIINTEEFDSLQADWLNTELDQSNAKWKIVVGHRPIISYESAHYLEGWTGKELLKQIICKKSQVYISGHSHMMELNEIPNCEAQQIVSGAGGAKIRKVIDEEFPLFYSEHHGFVSMYQVGDTLHFDFIDTNLNIINNQSYQFTDI